MTGEILVLRLIHVLSGVLWVGAMVFISVFLMPALQQVGPAAGSVMGALQQRRMMTYMPVLALLTILSGFRLYWIMSDGFSAAYLGTTMGMTFGAAGVLALLGYVLGMVVVRPSMGRVGALSQRLPSATDAERGSMQAEIQRLRTRGRAASTTVAVLVVVAAAGMAVARYL